MKFALIVGSHRTDSQTAKVARYLEHSITQEIAGAKTYTLNLGDTPLPMWDQGVWDGAESWKSVWSPISEELRSCDGAFVLAPEYGGMAPPALKNFFLLCTSQKELAHKPAVIAGISAARGGAYPVSELRASCYKNNYINFIPDHLIIRDVEALFNGAESSSEDESYLRDRIAYTVRVMHQYAIAGRNIRESGVLNLQGFSQWDVMKLNSRVGRIKGLT